MDIIEKTFFDEKLEIIKKAFVDFYGEQYQSLITERLKSLILIFYHNPKYMKEKSKAL